MYKWREMSDAERAAELQRRKALKLPWHTPPHLKYSGFVSFIFTAACYEHAHIIGKSRERLAQTETQLLGICRNLEIKIYAWCILPNHYHLLIRTNDLDAFKQHIKLFHGRASHQWNAEDNLAGRKVWFNFFERDMRSRRHLLASLNYVLLNPVRHGYAKRWQDWDFSSAKIYLQQVGHEKALKRWREYPLLDYGKDWDNF